MLDLLLTSSVSHTLLLVLPAVAALLFRALRCPGWPIVGGVVAGLLLGPTILGRVAPDAFEHFFVGGVTEREARDDLLRRHDADRVAATAGGVDATAWAALDARHGAERAPAEAALAAERWRFQRPLRSYTAAMALIVLLTAGCRQAAAGSRHPGWLAPLSVGAWAAALPGGIACAATMTGWGHPLSVGLLAGAAVAIGPWRLTDGDRTTADAAETGGAHLIERAGRVATLLALMAVAVAGIVASHGHASSAVWMAPLLALPVGRWIVWHRADVVRFVRAAVDAAFLPGLAACATIKVDLNLHAALWPTVIFVLLSGDGRWAGACLGAIVPGGRGGLRTMRLVLGAVACGPTQLAVTALAAHTWALPESIVVGLITGAVAVEVTARLRRRVGADIEELA